MKNMLETIKYSIPIVKLLLLIKLRGLFVKIQKILGIKFKASIYFIYKTIKTFFTFMIMLYIAKNYYDVKYNNIIIVIYTLILIIPSLGFIFDSYKNIWSPYNIELFQISNVKAENINFIFLITEYTWSKLKELDIILPTIFAMAYLYGTSIMLYTILVESLLFLVTIFKNNIIEGRKKGKVKKNTVRYLLKYITVNIIIISLMYKFSKLLLNICRICRKYLNSFHSLNEENLQNIKEEVLSGFNSFFTKFKVFLDIDLVNKYNRGVVLSLIFISLMAIYLILKYKKIDYSIQEYKVEYNSSELKERYINIMVWINKKLFHNVKIFKYIGYIIFQDLNFFNKDLDFLIYKDLNIIKNLKGLLKKDFFSTVVLPYDYFVIITLASVVIMRVSNEYLVTIFMIFCTVSLIFNQVNTLVITTEDIFKFREDSNNIELYKISKYNIKHILQSKIRLCLIMMLFPFIVYEISAVIILIIKFGMSLMLLKSIMLFFIITISIYFFAPKINLYIYAYIMSLSNSKSINKEEDNNEDELIHKFCELPKKLIIIPLMYLLLINSVMPLITNDMWKYILLLYVAITLVLVFVENNIIDKVLKSG